MVKLVLAVLEAVAHLVLVRVGVLVAEELEYWAKAQAVRVA
jgi:hypothetical protein